MHPYYLESVKLHENIYTLFLHIQENHKLHVHVVKQNVCTG